MPSLNLKPGSPIRLKGQPEAIPDFLVVRCLRDRCWVRQSSWKPDVELAVRITQIAIPDLEELLSTHPCPENVVSLGLYRFRRSLRR